MQFDRRAHNRRQLSRSLDAETRGTFCFGHPGRRAEDRREDLGPCPKAQLFVPCRHCGALGDERVCEDCAAAPVRVRRRAA